MSILCAIAMNNKQLKYLEMLNALVQYHVGFQMKWTRLEHLHDYIAKYKRSGKTEFVFSLPGMLNCKIPIDFALKYTAVPEVKQSGEPENLNMEFRK